ncbi:MAG TPA: tellurite resistance TerB family protein [Stellaceae bacterium]|nr:tellurite resistance TerB family protein [Stellaceae bacterium]
MTDHHAALIDTMILVAAADADITDAEFTIIGDIVGHLPAFRDYDRSLLRPTLDKITELLGREDGLESGLATIREELPPKLRETAYVLACDVVAADGAATQEELRILELLRQRLEIDRLIASAIERGSKARFATA